MMFFLSDEAMKFQIEKESGERNLGFRKQKCLTSFFI